MQRNGQTVPGTVTTAVGLVVFDGKGTYSVQPTVSVNGTTTTLPVQTGTCTIPGSSMTVHFERATGPCSNATITGDYAFQRNGQAGGGITLVALGTITFDGKGNQFVAQTPTAAARSPRLPTWWAPMRSMRIAAATRPIRARAR